jgi:hypothetical protein
MLTRLSSLLLALLLCACSAQVGNNGQSDSVNTGTKEQQEQVLAAAKSVATMIDAGRYSDSWKLVAPLLQAQTTQQDWASYIATLRTPLGTRGSSKLLGYGFPTKMAGAPAGQDGIIGLETDFANAKSVDEKYVFQRVGNEWKLAGYWLSKKFTVGAN